jgi:FkbM family methyltransferase
MTNFFRTVSVFYENRFINPNEAILRHSAWQVRKILNIFPHDLHIQGITVRIRDRAIANGCGALLNAMGFYDPNNMYLIREVFKNGFYKTFFDVGSNIGIYSLIAASESASRIFAFEPHPYTFSLLAENVALNGYGDRVNCLQAALGAEDGVAFFTDDPGSPVNHVLEKDGADQKELHIKILRGDTFCHEVGMYPEVLKIDVEGYESFVLQGFGDALKSVQIILIECRSIEKIERVLCGLYDFLGPYKLDYRIRKFTKTNMNYEDWIFLNPQTLDLLKACGFHFEDDSAI